LRRQGNGLTSSRGWASELVKAERRPLTRQRTVVRVFSIGAAAFFALPPIVFLVAASLRTGPIGSPGEFTVKNFISILSDPFLYSTLFNTLTFAAGSALIATFLGFLLALIVNLTDAPLSNHLSSVLLAMLALPGFLESMGWTFLLGKRSGLVNAFLMSLTGSAEPFIDVYSFLGMILVMGLSLTPVTFILISPAFQLIDRTLVEMSFVSGAGVLRTIKSIFIPIIFPAVVSTYIYVFIVALEAFDTPAIIGIPAGVYVLTTAIYKRMVSDIPPDYGGAAAYAILLMSISVTALWLYRFVLTQSEKYASLTGRAQTAARIRLRRMRYFFGGLVIAYLLLHPLPVIGVLLLASFHSFWNPNMLFQNLTLDNYIHFLTYPVAEHAARNSAVVALGTCMIAVPLGFMVSYFTYRRPFMGSNTLAVMASLPLAVPQTVLALGVFWATLFIDVGIYGTVWALIYAYALRYMPLVIRLTSGPLLQLHRELEDAAIIYGGLLRNIIRVVVPIIGGALLYAAVYVLTITLTNLGIAVLLVTSESVVVSTVLYALWNSGERLQTAAGGLIYFAATLSLTFLGRRILTRSIERT